MADYIMALDQGTTSSRAIIFDKEGRICSVKQKEFTQHFPNNGWVEHDPMEIWATQMSVMMEARETMGIRTEDIAAIGITNQRETTIVWDRKTGNPVYHAIVWQCRRTADRIEQLKAEGYDKVIREKTGLIVDPYFSATKIEWILDNVPGARERAEAGELLTHGLYTSSQAEGFTQRTTQTHRVPCFSTFTHWSGTGNYLQSSTSRRACFQQ